MACRWCNNNPNGFHYQDAWNNRSPENRHKNYRPCSHPGPVIVRAVPSATFRTTKYELFAGATEPGKPARPFKEPPKGGLYAQFMKACKKPIPTPEEVQ